MEEIQAAKKLQTLLLATSKIIEHTILWGKLELLNFELEFYTELWKGG